MTTTTECGGDGCPGCAWCSSDDPGITTDAVKTATIGWIKDHMERTKTAEEERYARHVAIKAALELRDTGLLTGNPVHRIQCAVITKGCQSALNWEEPTDGERLATLNGWRLDHGRWICGLHPVVPNMSNDLRTSIRIQIGAVVEHDPNKSFAVNREIEDFATDAVLSIFARWLRKQSTAVGMQYRAEAELTRLAEIVQDADHDC